ncbi:MAG: ATP-dependent zinc protease [Desulfomonile tiedjei]|nr:ATP-dependent zinc protease [Desulfomonile tiedjei]
MVNLGWSQSKQIAGWVEDVTILPEGLKLQAKLDTGADHSSLDVKDLAQFERKGTTWARFDVTNHVGRTATFERKVLRISKIKLHKGGHQPRPVVLMGICLGTHGTEVEVNLVDRSGFRYPLLIGRSFLQGRIVVDPAMEFALKPECSGATEQ